MKYTVTSDYYATGEGRTITICYVFAASIEAALKEFERLVYGGDWFVKGADAIEGWQFDSEIAQMLVTPSVKAQLEDTKCYQNYVATIHYNYS